jgi:hypothetical protein
VDLRLTLFKGVDLMALPVIKDAMRMGIKVGQGSGRWCQQHDDCMHMEQRLHAHVGAGHSDVANFMVSL